MHKARTFLLFLLLAITAGLYAGNSFAAGGGTFIFEKTGEEITAGRHIPAPELEPVSIPGSLNFSSSKGFQNIHTKGGDDLNCIFSNVAHWPKQFTQTCLYSAKKYLTHNHPFHHFW